MKSFLRILKYARPYKKYAFWNIFFTLFYVIFSVFSLGMLVPLLNLLFDVKQQLITAVGPFKWSYQSILEHFNYYLSSVIIQYGKLKALFLICGGVVLIMLLKNFCQYMAMYALAPLRNKIIRDLRAAIYRKTLKLPLAFYSNERKGDLMSRITNDVQEVEWSVLSALVILFKEPLTILVFIIVLFYISFKLTLFILVLLPIAGFIITRIAKSLKKQSSRSREKMGSILSIVEETLSGLRIIKAFNAQEKVYNRFQEENESHHKMMIHMFRRTDLSSPLSEFLGVFTLVVVMYFGGQMVLGNNESLQASVFLTYLAIFSQVINPAKNFTNGYYNMMRGVASAERIEAILDAPEPIKDKENAGHIKSFEQLIEYKNVSFAYSNEDVLKNINLKIEKGKMIALVGQSGAGKSTMADLLPRFYDVTKGEILIDGKNIIDLKLHDLNALMGIVTQESILFNDTIFNNIAFGVDDATEEKVIEAATVANAHEFIMQQEKGYQTNIGDRGGKLSGGQRQRLAIARAVLKNPPILILDEATSALDTESERLVQDALFKLMQHRTSLVIAHRLSTIQHSDMIVVMNKGEILETGTHQELLQLNGTYKKLCDLQTFL